MFNQAAYNAFVTECKRVAASPDFGFVSITAAAKQTGMPRGQLSQTARAFGLHVAETKSGGNGRYGVTAQNDRG